ncbi:MAG: TetR/AcrR family transcriptional regulator [Niameybacter sp.]|uniref:TetR/AcrR family transcriptional regulator n=1 Tax=Niameybacter sp. TaxID=2033640 RepID=UPI002FC9A5DC
MTEKLDLRVERTQKTIQRAFIDLLHITPYPNIYIKDIAEKAMINRKTFYTYYDNKDILYDEIISLFFERLCSTFIYEKQVPTHGGGREDLSSDVYQFLALLEAEKEDLFYLLHPTLNPLWFPLLESTIIMKKNELHIRSSKKESAEDIPFKLYIDTISSLFVIWIYWWLSQEEYTLEQGTKHLCRMMNKTMPNIFRYSKPPLYNEKDEDYCTQ